MPTTSIQFPCEAFGQSFIVTADFALGRPSGFTHHAAELPVFKVTKAILDPKVHIGVPPKTLAEVDLWPLMQELGGSALFEEVVYEKFAQSGGVK